MSFMILNDLNVSIFMNQNCFDIKKKVSIGNSYCFLSMIMKAFM